MLAVNAADAFATGLLIVCKYCGFEHTFMGYVFHRIINRKLSVVCIEPKF